MRSLFLALTALCFIVSCSSHRNKVPKDVLPPEKMQSVLWSMITAGEFLNGYVIKDSVDRLAASAKVYGQALQIHHLTKEEFAKSYSYYRKHPELMKPILDSLSKRQNYNIEQMQKRQDSVHTRIMQKAKSQ